MALTSQSLKIPVQTALCLHSCFQHVFENIVENMNAKLQVLSEMARWRMVAGDAGSGLDQIKEDHCAKRKHKRMRAFVCIHSCFLFLSFVKELLDFFAFL